MKIEFKTYDLTCCSVGLTWEIRGLGNNTNINYLLEQKEGEENFFGTGFIEIYNGPEKIYEIENLQLN